MNAISHRSTYLGLILALSAVGSSALAAEFTVNTKKDRPDLTPLGDGVVDVDLQAPGDQISLRAAIQEANALSGVDTITLPAGKYKLTRKGFGEDQAATGDLDVTDGLIIVGAGAEETVIDGRKAKDRIFHVRDTGFNLYGVTLRKGKVKDASGRGGGVFAEENSSVVISGCVIQRCSARDDGGGVALRNSDAVITDTLFEKNKAKDDGGGLDATTAGNVTVERVTFLSNKAKQEGGAAEASSLNATFVNCTFHKNKALDGGAVNLEEGGDYDFTSCTFSKNRSKVGGSAISEQTLDGDPETIRIANSIFADWKKKSYAGDGVTSLGGNLDSGTTFGFAGPGDLEGLSPRLGKLTKTDGAPPTIALKSDSPAIDAANDGLAPATDQRGLPRVDQPGVGAAIADIGAFEAQ